MHLSAVKTSLLRISNTHPCQTYRNCLKHVCTKQYDKVVRKGGSACCPMKGVIFATYFNCLYRMNLYLLVNLYMMCCRGGNSKLKQCVNTIAVETWPQQFQLQIKRIVARYGKWTAKFTFCSTTYDNVIIPN